MRRKYKHITVSVTEEQDHRTRLLAAEFDTTVTSLVAYLLERLPDALRRAHYPKSHEKIPMRRQISQKFVLKLCSHLTRKAPAAYTRFQPAILWQYPSIVSANA